MRSRTALILIVVTLAGAGLLSGQGRGRGGGQGAQVKPGEECPPGTTEVRPGRCQAPETPPPSIVDYRPKPTLVVPAHPVPKAKYPVIDLHAHPPPLTSAQTVETVVSALDALNLRMMIVTGTPGPVSSEQMRQYQSVVAGTRHAARFAFFTSVSFREMGPGFAQKAVAQLEADVKAGARGLGEIGKSFGLTTQKADGTRLKLDDPELDPIWAAAARLGIPVMLHVGDPASFWQPFDYSNERWLEMALFPSRRCPPDRCLAFEELVAERDRLFKKHPKTKFVAAHFGWQANDLGRLSKLLDEAPNVYLETGAILYDLGRQPRVARDFMVKYQDRVLFGKDVFAPDEYPYYWRTFETADDYFDYYRHYHAFWKLYGLALPDPVLRKLYFENALKLIPGLPAADFPK